MHVGGELTLRGVVLLLGSAAAVVVLSRHDGRVREGVCEKGGRSDALRAYNSRAVPHVTPGPPPSRRQDTLAERRALFTSIL